MTKRNPKKPFRNAFTLVELLVVMSIISMLIAILLPALSKAYDVSKAIQCGSNLRSIGTMVSYYQADWKGFTIAADMEPAQGDTLSWHHILYNDYANYARGAFICPATFRTPVVGNFKPSNGARAGHNPYNQSFYTTNAGLFTASYILNCIPPSATINSTWGTNNSNHPWYGATDIQAAGYSSVLIRGWTGTVQRGIPTAGSRSTGYDRKIPLRFEKAQNPSSSIFLLDHNPNYDTTAFGSSMLDGLKNFQETDWATVDDQTTSPRLRAGRNVHSNTSMNILYGDNHVLAKGKTDQREWIVVNGVVEP